MHKHHDNIGGCLQATVTRLTDELKATCGLLNDKLSATATLLGGLTASATLCGDRLGAEAHLIKSELNASVSLFCDVSNEFLRVSPNVVWFTADDLDGANFDIMSNVVWTINIPWIDVVSTLTNDIRISNSSLFENGMQSQEAVDWLLNSTPISNKTMIRDVSTLVRAELSNSILLTNKHYLRNAI